MPPLLLSWLLPGGTRLTEGQSSWFNGMTVYLHGYPYRKLWHYLRVVYNAAHITNKAYILRFVFPFSFFVSGWVGGRQVSVLSLYLRITTLAITVSWRHFTAISTLWSTVCSDIHQNRHQSSASMPFFEGNHWWLMVSAHEGHVAWECFHVMTSPLTGTIMWVSRCQWNNPW